MTTKGATSLALFLAFSLPAAAQENLEQAVLKFVNDPATTHAQLKYAVQLGYSGSTFDDYIAEKAATSILVHRAGWDRVYGTSDDNPFDTLLELYEGTDLGPEGMEGIEVYVGKGLYGLNGPSAILQFVNDKKTSVKLLDGPVGLYSQAAGNLVAYRNGGPDLNPKTKKDNQFVPYTRVFGTGGVYSNGSPYPTYPAHSVDAVPYVGPSSIQKLFDYAMGATGGDGGTTAYVLTEADGNLFLAEAVDAFLAANGESLWSNYGYGAFGGEAYTDDYSKNFFLNKIRNFLLDHGSATWGATAELVGQTFSSEAAARQAIAEVVSGLWEQNAQLWLEAYAEMIGEATP